MEPRIETLAPKNLAGLNMPMSLADNKTALLWKSFMPRRHEIENAIGANLYSMQVYSTPFNFNPATVFEKWAAVEVSNFSNLPNGMQHYPLPGGLYAVFKHIGAAATGPKTFGYIFGEWLPASNYLLDDRPHFEVLGEKYKNNHPASEEEIWIPIKPKPQHKG